MKLWCNILLMLFATCIQAQSYSDIANEKTGTYSYVAPPIVGLWKVNKVRIGNEEMTPIARWFQFNIEGSYEGGNGGMQNGIGTYNYDLDKTQLWQAINGKSDPYGPFKVKFKESKMTWSRLEDGMQVTVTLTKTKKKPIAPWDMIQGYWTIERVAGYDKDSDDLKSEYMLDPDRYYFGWDRRYRKYNKDGKRTETGIWHIEAHSNWLWTISDADNTKTGYALELKGNEMIWTKDGENEKLKITFIKE